MTQPKSLADRLREMPLICGPTNEDAQRFLREQGGAISIGVLTSIALDEKQPAGARAAAGKALSKLAGVGVTEDDTAKDLHEMNGEELAAYRQRLALQLDALERERADRARPVIDGITANVFD